jgi:hypothetical protein
MLGKSNKLEWHKRMRYRACNYATETCQKCGRKTDIQHGVIHHAKYPPGVYTRDVEDLMEEGICVWLCRDCHNKIHIAHTFEESKDHLKSGGYCKHCGKLVFGCWDRARTLGLDYCICRRCYKKMKSVKQQEESGQLRLF